MRQRVSVADFLKGEENDVQRIMEFRCLSEDTNKTRFAAWYC